MRHRSFQRAVVPAFMLTAVTLGSGAHALAQVLPYKDPKLPVEARVKDLLGRMTLDEKIGQMVQADSDSLKLPDVSRLYLGSVLSGGGSGLPDVSAKGWYTYVEQAQKQAHGTRLGIPILHGIDAVHGHNNVHKVFFLHRLGAMVTSIGSVQTAVHL